jgi:anti-sigma regulatory factor (Ser/Thr protein kinase)
MLLDDATLVVSELVTNALRAGARLMTLTLVIEPGHLRVTVTDDVTARPRLLETPPEALHGRGLHIVSTLATDWGFTRLSNGKEVWADLSLIPIRSL